MNNVDKEFYARIEAKLSAVDLEKINAAAARIEKNGGDAEAYQQLMLLGHYFLQEGYNAEAGDQFKDAAKLAREAGCAVPVLPLATRPQMPTAAGVAP